MKRKLLVLTLVTALIATLLVGCGNTEEPTAETEVETVEETVEAEPEVVEDEPTETVAAEPLNLEPVNLEELGLTLAEEAAEDEEVEAEVEEEKETVKEEKTETNTNVVANNTTTANTTTSTTNTQTSNSTTDTNNSGGTTNTTDTGLLPIGRSCAIYGHEFTPTDTGVIINEPGEILGYNTYTLPCNVCGGNGSHIEQTALDPDTLEPYIIPCTGTFEVVNEPIYGEGRSYREQKPRCIHCGLWQ